MKKLKRKLAKAIRKASVIADEMETRARSDEWSVQSHTLINDIEKLLGDTRGMLYEVPSKPDAKGEYSDGGTGDE